MTEAIIDFFKNTIQNDILTIIVIAVIPIIELRGSIPVGVAMGMPLWEAFLWAWVGSSLVCPVLLLILRPVLDWMKKTKWFRSLALAIEGNFRSRADKVVKESERNDPKKMKKKMLGVLRVRRRASSSYGRMDGQRDSGFSRYAVLEGSGKRASGQSHRRSDSHHADLFLQGLRRYNIDRIPYNSSHRACFLYRDGSRKDARKQKA